MADPTARALTLLGLLESRAVWSGSELAERLGVTTRSVRRDIDRLRRLGYTVEADAGAAGGYSLGRGQVLPPLLLDEDEGVAVTLALSAAVVDGGGAQPEVALRALGKLEDVMPGALRRRLQGLRESMELAPRAASADPALLMTCAEAVRRQQRLRFGYRDRRGSSTHRLVEPYRLVLRGQVWRLVTYDLDREDWRTFRLDRLVEPEVSTWRFTPREGVEDVLRRLDEAVPASAWRHQVLVHVHAPYESVAHVMPQLAGRLRPLDETTTEFVAGADDPPTAAWWLARIPYDFTVLGDEAIRAATGELGRRLARGAATGVVAEA